MRPWVKLNSELRSVPLVGIVLIGASSVAPAMMVDGGAATVKSIVSDVVEREIGNHSNSASVYSFAIPGRTLSCDPPPLLPPEALNEADVVFRGTAISSDYNRDLDIRKTRLRVHQVWKGAVLPGAQVASNLLSTGLLLQDEREYIVYADIRPSYLWSDACMGTSSKIAQHVSLLPRVSTWFDLLLPQLTK